MSSAASQAGTSEGSFLGISYPDLPSDFISMEDAAVADNVTRGNILNAQAYNTQMADTVYQRGRADMVAAGLNPILAAGSPDPMASSPMAAASAAQAQGNISGGNVSSSTASPADVAQQQAQTQSALASSAAATANAVKAGKEAGLLDLKFPEAQSDATTWSGPAGKALGYIQAMNDAGLGKSSAAGIGAEAAFTAGTFAPSSGASSAVSASEERSDVLNADPANGLGVAPDYSNGATSTPLDSSAY